MKKTESELLAEINADLDKCIPYDGSTVASDRAKAMKYYLAEPFGNEVDGRSQVVTSDVADTIEWMLPQLIRIFTSSDEAVMFDPVGPEDEEAAKQETDYLNHVFYKDNDGFMILYNWFKDALLLKNGIVKYFWEENTEKNTEEYEYLNQMELQMLMQDPNVEVKEQNMGITPLGEPFIDIKIERTNKKGRVRIIVIPPEDFRIDASYDSLDLKDCTFCAHVTYKTKQELKEMGYPASKIDDLTDYADDGESDQERDARFEDISAGGNWNDGRDDTRVLVAECYKKLDWNGDGYAEIRKITLANGSEILDNEEIDYLPFVSITPIAMPHRFFGRSIPDITMDLQLLKSTLLRNILDNLYLINNVRMGIVEGEVNVDDALDSRPGGVVRMTAPNMLFPIQTTPFGGHSYQMMEYLDSMKENRTGVTRYNQGMNADVLNKTATGITKIMSASQERMMLVARLFADGVAKLFTGMHRLILQNQDKERVIRIRNKWVPINPSEWKERENMTINVALGTNDKQQEAANLMLIAQAQKEFLSAGFTNIITPQHLYTTAKKLVEATGMKHYELFFQDPSTVPPPQPQPNAQDEFLKAQAQVEMAKVQLEQQRVELEKQQAVFEAQMAQQKAQLEQQKLKLEAEKAALAGVTDGNRISMDRYKTDLKAQGDAFKVKGDIIKTKIQSEAKRDNRSDSDSRN
jgi:hypothetical protein